MDIPAHDLTWQGSTQARPVTAYQKLVHQGTVDAADGRLANYIIHLDGHLNRDDRTIHLICFSLQAIHCIDRRVKVYPLSGFEIKAVNADYTSMVKPHSHTTLWHWGAPKCQSGTRLPFAGDRTNMLTIWGGIHGGLVTTCQSLLFHIVKVLYVSLIILVHVLNSLLR